MNDKFVSMLSLSVLNYFEIGAFLTSAGSWYWIKRSALRFFLPYLFFILIVEMTGRYYRVVLGRSNTWLYNITIPIEVLFYIFIFLCYFKSSRIRIGAVTFLIAYPLFVIVTLAVNGLSKFNVTSVIIGNFFVIVAACFLFYEFLLDGTREKPFRDPMFWIATGVLFFFTGEFFYDLLFSYINVAGLNDTRFLFQVINNNLNLVLYCSISIGLVCEAVMRKY